MESGNRRIVYVSSDDLKDLVLSRSKWCPLFGFIVYPDVSPSSNLSRCVDIITEARRLWSIPFLSGGSYDSYPHPDNLPGNDLYPFPKEELLTARALLKRAPDIMFHAQIKNPLTDYNPETGEPAYDPDQLDEDKIMYQVSLRGLRGYKGVKHDIENYKVFAILAIYEARWALRLMLEDGKTEKDTEVLKAVQIATNLLNRARDIKARIEIENMKEDAELGAKRRIQQRNFAKEMHKGKEREHMKRNNEIIATGKDKKKKNPSLSTNAVADILYKSGQNHNLSIRTLRKILARNL